MKRTFACKCPTLHQLPQLDNYTPEDKEDQLRLPLVLLLLHVPVLMLRRFSSHSIRESALALLLIARRLRIRLLLRPQLLSITATFMPVSPVN